MWRFTISPELLSVHHPGFAGDPDDAAGGVGADDLGAGGVGGMRDTEASPSASASVFSSRTDEGMSSR